MRLLIISSEYPNMIGGVGDYTMHLSNELAKLKFEIFLLTSKNEKIQFSNQYKVLPKIDKWNFKGLFTIMSLLKEIKPDCINLQYSPYGYNKYGLPTWIIFFTLWLSFKGYKLLTTFHEIAINFSYSPKIFIIAAIQRLIAYLLALTSKKIVVTIEYSRRMLFCFRNKISKIPVGSNITPIEISNYNKNIFKKTIAPNNEIILSTFGRMSTYRRHELLIDIIGYILNTYNSILLKFIILGDCTEETKLKLEDKINKFNLNQNILITNYLQSEEVFKYLSISDIFILLNADDRGGIGIKSGSIAAAYASGLPIISINGPLTDDFFIDGDNIYFAKSTSKSDLANAILKLVNDKDLRNKLKVGANTTYSNKLKWDVIAKQYKNILDSI